MKNLIWSAAFSLEVLLFLSPLQMAQESAAGVTRASHSDAFKQMREKGSAAKSPSQLSSPAEPQTRPAPDDLFVGLNLWRMRLAEASAPVRVRGLKHRTDPEGAKEWTAERIALAQPVAEGEILRISVESAQSGYLYIINRDVYANGDRSQPILIFPTLSLRGGNNRVEPGVPVELPDFRDQPPAFTVERTRADQNGIELLLMVTPKPLAEISVRNSEQGLREEQVASWVRAWGSNVDVTEDSSTVGAVYTLAERRAAGDDPSRPLGPDDPVPLTLFHRQGRPEAPMLVIALIKLAPPGTDR